jgi:bromodomain and PHD finger-containing protein 1
MSMHATSANKIEYLVFCDKHTPFKLKRVLETKYRLYEKEIVEFFKSYEKYRVHVNKQAKQKIE